MPSLCLDCTATGPETARLCPVCRFGRLASHPELLDLKVAHVDCDAFYASVEKRDRPELAGRPVIVGGGARGVVTTACYIARINGVRSAMPMFKALAACPDAVVIRPDFAKYSAAARRIRALMQSLTPIVQTLSIDEAVLDLTGTEALHGAAPAIVLARLANRIEHEVGVTVSIWRLCEKLAGRLRGSDHAASGIVLKLRTSRFAIRTRNQRLVAPTVLPDTLFAAGRELLAREVDGTFFRLVGIGANPLVPIGTADLDDLADPDRSRRARAQAAVDALRTRYGNDVVIRGRALQPQRASPPPNAPVRSTS